MKKIVTTFALAMISIAMFAQIDFNLFIRDIGNYSRIYTDDHVIDMKAMKNRKNGYWREIFMDYGRNPNPAIARRDRYIYNDDLYRFDFPSSKEMKKINKEIEKRNRKIMKQQEKTMKAWEKEEKKIRKEQKKWTKKGNRW